MCALTFWMIVDALCWAASLMVIMWVPLAESGVPTSGTSTWALAATAAITHAVLGLVIGPYRVIRLGGSFEEMVSVTWTALATASALVVAAFLLPALMLPRSVALFGTSLAIVLMCALRLLLREVRTRQLARRPRADKVIVLGAGLAGRRLVHTLLAEEDSDLTPVALLDDDRGKRRLRVEGVPVRGTRHDILAVAALTGARHVVVAVPGATPELLRKVHEACPRTPRPHGAPCHAHLAAAGRSARRRDRVARSGEYCCAGHRPVAHVVPHLRDVDTCRRKSHIAVHGQPMVTSVSLADRSPQSAPRTGPA